MSSSVSETEQRPPISSRLMLVLSWGPERALLSGRTSDAQVSTPAPRKVPAGKLGNVTVTLPVLGLVPTDPDASAFRPTGQGRVFENGCPVTVTAADG